MTPCPLTGSVSLDGNCETCMSFIRGSCRHAQTVNVEGDAAATATLYGVNQKAVEAKCLRIRRGIVAALFFQHVTGRAIEDARAKDFDHALSAEASYELWTHPGKEPWATTQHYLRTLSSLLTAPFERNLYPDHDSQDSDSTRPASV